MPSVKLLMELSSVKQASEESQGIPDPDGFVSSIIFGKGESELRLDASALASDSSSYSDESSVMSLSDGGFHHASCLSTIVDEPPL